MMPCSFPICLLRFFLREARGLLHPLPEPDLAAYVRGFPEGREQRRLWSLSSLREDSWMGILSLPVSLLWA